MPPLQEFLGYVAACCTTFAFLPQAIKTIRTRDTRSLSLGMYLLFTVGLALWFFYGLYKRDLAIVAANAVTGVFALVILIHKVRNDVIKR
jgi:MtN3 and saliva related transmembrane protein